MSQTATFEWQGRTRTLAVLEQCPEALALWEAWLERRAFEAAVRQRGTLRTEDHFRAALREALLSAAAGEFQWGGALSERARVTYAGVGELIFLCVSRHDPNWTRRDQEQLMADAAKVAELHQKLHGQPWPPPAPAGEEATDG